MTVTLAEVKNLIDEAIKKERERLVSKLRGSIGYKEYNRRSEAYEFDWDRTVDTLTRDILKDD